VTEFCVWRAGLWRNFVFGGQDCDGILIVLGGLREKRAVPRGFLVPTGRLLWFKDLRLT
jgi:hypothetical protein